MRTCLHYEKPGCLLPPLMPHARMPRAAHAARAARATHVSRNPDDAAGFAAAYASCTYATCRSCRVLCSCHVPRNPDDEAGSAAAALAWMPTLRSRVVVGWWMGPLRDFEELMRVMQDKVGLVVGAGVEARWRL